MELTRSFEDLLLMFAPVFTQPSFQTFRLLMTGWILSVRHRYITDLIISSDSVDNGHFSDYHRFFSQAVWDIDHLWKLLATLIVDTLIGRDATIVLAGDDTLCRKRGLGIFGTGMHHDPLSSSKSKKIFHWGHDWVDLCIVISNPWWAPSKVFALPICMRLHRNRQGLKKGTKKTKKKPTAKAVKAASSQEDTWAAKNAPASMHRRKTHTVTKADGELGASHIAGRHPPGRRRKTHTSTKVNRERGSSLKGFRRLAARVSAARSRGEQGGRRKTHLRTQEDTHRRRRIENVESQEDTHRDEGDTP